MAYVVAFSRIIKLKNASGYKKQNGYTTEPPCHRNTGCEAGDDE